MSEIQRYWHDGEGDADWPYESVDGKWVLYADHLSEIEEATRSGWVMSAQIGELEEKLQDALSEIAKVREELRLKTSEAGAYLADMERTGSAVMAYLVKHGIPGTPKWPYEDLIDDAEVSRAEIAALKEQVAWRPITEDSLPEFGDEALCIATETHGSMVLTCGFDSRPGDSVRYLEAGYTHFRKINAPEAK